MSAPPEPWDTPEIETVYLASPVSTYNTPRYQEAVEALERNFPDARVIQARGRYPTSGDWLARWPVTLQAIDALVFFAAEDETIGTGVLRELVDALAARLPCWYLELVEGREGRLLDISALSLELLGPASRERCARVELRGAA